jgi:hypothetical protein
MRLLIFTCIFYAIVFTKCYGPLLSERYVCNWENENSSLLWVLLANGSKAEEERKTYIELALAEQIKYDNKGKNKSSVKPWWL